MLAMRARSGSDARIGAETVSVTRADWASMVDVFLCGCRPSRVESRFPAKI